MGNTFGATVLSSYGGFWISYALMFHPNMDIFSSHHAGPDGKPLLVYSFEERCSTLALFLTAWFIFTFMMMLCSLKSTLMFFLLFLGADLGFLLLACENYAGSMGNMTAMVSLQKAGGVVCMITAFLAFYNALAGLQDHRYVVADAGSTSSYDGRDVLTWYQQLVLYGAHVRFPVV